MHGTRNGYEGEEGSTGYPLVPCMHEIVPVRYHNTPRCHHHAVNHGARGAHHPLLPPGVKSTTRLTSNQLTSNAMTSSHSVLVAETHDVRRFAMLLRGIGLKHVRLHILSLPWLT